MVALNAGSQPALHPATDTVQQVKLMIAFADEVTLPRVHHQLARHSMLT